MRKLAVFLLLIILYNINLSYNMPNHKPKFLKNGYIPYATQEVPRKFHQIKERMEKKISLTIMDSTAILNMRLTRERLKDALGICNHTLSFLFCGFYRNVKNDL